MEKQRQILRIKDPNWDSSEKKEDYGSGINVRKAFKILECDTLSKKIGYKIQYKKLALKKHPDRLSRLAIREEERQEIGENFKDINRANDFLRIYERRVRSLGYETAKVFCVWFVFLILKTIFLKIKLPKDEKILDDKQGLFNNKRPVWSFVVASFTHLINMIFLAWLIFSVQEKL